MLDGELKCHRRLKRPSSANNITWSSAITAYKTSQHENCALLGYYAACGGNSLLMFRDNLEHGIYILEDGTDRLSQNVSKELAPHTAK